MTVIWIIRIFLHLGYTRHHEDETDAQQTEDSKMSNNIKGILTFEIENDVDDDEKDEILDEEDLREPGKYSNTKTTFLRGAISMEKK